MRIIVMLAVSLLCLGCDTKKKLDMTLDNANDTIRKANMKLDELSELAHDLKGDLSDAVKQAGEEASKTISHLGTMAGDIPESGGEVKETDTTTDLDEDGKADSVTAVEYDDQYLWLVEASTLDGFACKTQLYFVTDNPPEEIFAWGLVAEGCGAMACSPEELEKDEPDLDNCECEDAEENAIACAELEATLAGVSGDGDGDGDGDGNGDGDGDGDGEPSALACSDGSDAIAFDQVCDGTSDCADDSDEACGIVWLCSESEVIAPESVCDGADDCSNGADEGYCDGSDWICDSGDESLATVGLCDGADDCSDGSDELYCGLVWVCDDQEELIGAGGVCDGVSDCTDGSDEARCE